MWRHLPSGGARALRSVPYMDCVHACGQRLLKKTLSRSHPRSSPPFANIVCGLMWKKLLNIEKKAPDQVQHVFHQDQPGTGQPGPQPVGGGTGAAPPSILQSSPSQSPMSAEPIFVPVPEGKAKHVHEPSRDTFDIAGLPVFVYGLSQLSPPTEKGCPEVCIAIHMHGRTGSAKREDDLARELWRSTMSARAALPSSHRVRDFLLVTFDQRNHGERKTNPRGQKSWKEGNPTHGYV